MKKVLAILLALVLCLSIVACGKTPENNGEKSETTSNVDPSKETEQGNSSEDSAPADLPGVLSINLESVKYCINAPSKQIFNKGYNFVNMEDYFVIFDQYEETSELIYGVDLSKITKPSDVIEGMKDQFIAACSYGLIRASEYEIDIKCSDVKVNGWDMTKFIGEFALKFEVENPQVDYTTAKFVGYSVIKDGCPVYFVVVDIPTEGGVDDIGTMADKIAKTFREYSED